jgi:anaerobic ribonucleoside-triphosphate reductase
MKELENGDLQLDNGMVIPAAKRTKTEVYSRVVGYLRPVSQWNKGKKAEWRDRKDFVAPSDSTKTDLCASGRNGA